MFRLVMITVVSVSVLHCTQADAQLLFGRRHQSARGAQLQRYDTSRQAENDRTYRSYRPSSGLDISIGIGSYPGYGYYSGFGAYGYLDPYRFDGYGYDPYRYGSFEAPDLLKDPYFRERYRYDSKFPGRYRAPAIPRTSTAATIEDLYRLKASGTDRRVASTVRVDSARLISQLRKATEQLTQGLTASEYGEAWLEYLGPDQLPALIAQGKMTELQELMTHYDGVVANPELQYIMATSGFAETRYLLRHYLGKPVHEMGSRSLGVAPLTVEPAESTRSESAEKPETLPAPQPAVDNAPGLNTATGD